AELKAAEAAKKITADQFAAKRQELTNVQSATIHDWKLTGEFFEAVAPPRGAANEQPAKRKKFIMVLNQAQRENLKLTDDLIAQGVELQNELPQDSGWAMLLFYSGLSLLFLLVLFFFIRRAQNQMMGSGFLGTFAKSPAKRYDANKT